MGGSVLSLEILFLNKREKILFLTNTHNTGHRVRRLTITQKTKVPASPHPHVPGAHVAVDGTWCFKGSGRSCGTTRHRGRWWPTDSEGGAEWPGDSHDVGVRVPAACDPGTGFVSLGQLRFSTDVSAINNGSRRGDTHPGAERAGGRPRPAASVGATRRGDRAARRAQNTPRELSFVRGPGSRRSRRLGHHSHRLVGTRCLSVRVSRFDLSSAELTSRTASVSAQSGRLSCNTEGKPTGRMDVGGRTTER